MYPFRTRRETEWRPDLWQDPPPVAFEEITDTVPPNIVESFLTDEGGFHGIDPPEMPLDEFNGEDELDFDLPFEAEDESTPFVPMDSQTTRFGRVSRRKSDPDYVFFKCFGYFVEPRLLIHYVWTFGSPATEQRVAPSVLQNTPCSIHYSPTSCLFFLLLS